MKILVFTSLYPNNVWPHHGVFVKERMTRVAQLDDCQVQVVAPVPYFPPIKISSRWRYSQVARQETIEGLDVHHPRYFMIPKIGMSTYGLTMFLSVLPAVRRLQRSFDFDLIDAHYVYPDGFAAVLLGRVFKKPVVVSARGSDINLFSQFPLIRHLLRYALRRADHVICVSRALKEKVVALGVTENKVTVIPNGVDPKKFYPLQKEKARDLLGLPQKRIILSVGNLTPNKGFDVLVKAFRLLVDSSQEQGLFLVIVGDGVFRQPLEALILQLGLSESVRLAGDKPHQELFRWYSAADLFCLASEREGWPNVLLESLACGTPAVATPVGGIPEIICSEQVGLLSQRHEQTIAETIAKAFLRSWDRMTISHYANGYSWDQTARNVQSVFQFVFHEENPPLHCRKRSSQSCVNSDASCDSESHARTG